MNSLKDALKAAGFTETPEAPPPRRKVKTRNLSRLEAQERYRRAHRPADRVEDYHVTLQMSTREWAICMGWITPAEEVM